MISPATTGRRVSLSLGSGDASNFTVGKYYFIYDFNGHSQVEYVKVLSVNTGTDTIVVDPLNYSYSSGSKIGSYPHRFYVGCLGHAQTFAQYGCIASGIKVPYAAVYPRTTSTTLCERIFHNQNGLVTSYCWSLEDAMNNIVKSVLGEYYVQRFPFTEIKDNTPTTSNYITPGNILGTPNHMYAISPITGLVALVDIVVINGVNYYYVGTIVALGVAYPLVSNMGLLIQAQSS